LPVFNDEPCNDSFNPANTAGTPAADAIRSSSRPWISENSICWKSRPTTDTSAPGARYKVL
jgi:hypothetical protein